MQQYKPWNEKDFEILRDGYKKGDSPENIAKKLNRSKKSIIIKANVIGVSKAVRVFDENEKLRLRDWYETHLDELNLEELSKELNRTVPFLCRQAKILNLTHIGRKPKAVKQKLIDRLREYNVTHKDVIYFNLKKAQLINSQTKDLRSEKMKAAWMNPDSKFNSDEYRKAKSEKLKSMWADPNCKLNSLEYREKKSKQQSEEMINRMRNNKSCYSRSHGGKRSDLNDMYFRSSWEANYARYLNFCLAQKSIYKWEYEPDTYYFENIKRGIRSYTPDFKIWKSNDSTPFYVEVKGYMDEKSKTKLKRMNKYYPDVLIELVCEKEYKEIKRKLGAMLHFE